ncbi:hypothetical protein, conserved [Eimeria praecox]|uniref:Uncharacterized protein n=1 Tax=Eimeria praecox TaxID=51316 RepID=U6G310_9EIME|nr:hypothetical protein, conserved [Eimeria praecox]
MARKSFRTSRVGAGDWMTEMIRAIVDDSSLESLGISAEDAGKAVARNVFPVIKKRIAFIVGYTGSSFEAALVDEITQGEGPISSLELLEKVKEASQRIKELTGIIESQSEKMRELESNLAQANEFLDKVENVKEDALTAAEKSKEFAKKEEEKFPKTNKEFLEQLRSELREEVALELAEQATAATAASNTETAEKEVQTDPVSLEPAASTPESVPVAPPSAPAPEASPDTSRANQQLTDADRDLLRSCLEEIRHLNSTLSSHAGSLSVCQQSDVAESRRGVSLRNSCVGTSEGVLGGHQGTVYEHVPLTTLHLSPIYRAHPQREELGSARSIRLSAPLSPHGRLQLERPSEDHSNAGGPSLGPLCPPSEPTFAAAASGTVNRPSVAVETATLQDAPQQQTFVNAHMMSAELPEEVSVPPTQDYSLHPPCPPAEGSIASSSLSREGSTLKPRKPGATKAQGKLQISFADEPLLTSDPPGSSSASSTIFNQTENMQHALDSPQELSEPVKATAAETPERENPSHDSGEKAASSVSGVQQQQQQQQTTEKKPDEGLQEQNASPGGGAASISLSHTSLANSLISDGERQATVQGEKSPVEDHQHPDPQQPQQQEEQPRQHQQEEQPTEQQQEEEAERGQQVQQEQEQAQQHDRQQQQLQAAEGSRSMTRDNSFCLPPEAIFGQHGPPIWPMVTGGLSWYRSHETKTIPLAPLQRQVRAEFRETVVPIECTGTPLLMCPGKSVAVGRERYTEFSQELPSDAPSEHRPPSADTSNSVYIPLKGSKLGTGTRKLSKKEPRPTPESTCKTLNDLRIRNQVLETQVLGLSVALRQAHERLNTLTRASDTLRNGVPVPK